MPLKGDILDYDMTFKQPAQDALYEPNAFRSSDHDPVLVGLDVCDEIAPELNVSVTPDRLWPPNHKYVSATSNEPGNAPGGGDGNTTNDAWS